MTDEDSQDSQLIYTRLTQEPANWYARFLLYRNMSPVKRSLLGVYNLYQSQVQKSEKKYIHPPGSWNDAFKKYDWQFRAELYDEHQQAEAEARAKILREIEQDEIEKILTEGYALKHKRVSGLARMAEAIEKSFIDEETQEINYEWLAAKSGAERIREYRGCLDDIAKELGDRQKLTKTELTGKDGKPVEIKYVTEWGSGALTDEDMEAGG
jgi:hypothetical protein